MAWHVDLRDDSDEALSGVIDEVAELPSGVVAAGPISCGPGGANVGELGPSGDLDPPTLVIGQVQVQDVHLEERHDVDHAVQLFG